MTDPSLFPLPEEQKPNPLPPGKVRLQRANRQQVEMRLVSLDELVPPEHRVRVVWAMVQSYDLSRFYARIQAVEGEAGRPAIDPQILVALWLFATLEGVGSARALAKLCEESLPYLWLLGGIGVNYHTLADFRVNLEGELDELLTTSVAALLQEGLVDLERTAQDGVRIRASAGASSFRRAETLEKCLQAAEQHIQQLKAQSEAGENEPLSARQQAAQQRHAQQKVERVQKALQEVQKVAQKKAKNRESKRKNRPARASTTDPQARVMKMADGGFRPAYNGQVNLDMSSGIIVGVDLSQEGDTHELLPMVEHTQERYHRFMKEHYVDGGFRSNAGLTQVAKMGVTVYSPIPHSYNVVSKHAPEEILASDSPQVAEWKQRMQTAEAKEKYKQRAATVEWGNAFLRNHGLYRFLVRGLKKARAVLLWLGLAHNLLQTCLLRKRAQAVSV
jgi:transposase